jgi:hypothetical protein
MLARKKQIWLAQDEDLHARDALDGDGDGDDDGDDVNDVGGDNDNDDDDEEVNKRGHQGRQTVL